MRIKTVLLTAVTAGTLCSAATMAEEFKPIELKVDEKEIGLIEVSGDHLDAYRKVVTTTMSYSLWVRGDSTNSQGDTVSSFTLSAVEKGIWIAKFQSPLYEDWNKHKVTLQYYDISLDLGASRLAPVKRCNDALKQTTGAARQDFLYNGTTISMNKVYQFRALLTQGDGQVVTAPVTIRCLPLDHDPMRAKLRIEPAKVEQVGKFLCPMELNLHGAIASREKFTGKAIFVGPHYLSGITALDYAKAGNRNVRATYKINWKSKGGFTTTNNNVPAKQDLTFRLNIADKSGKVVETVEERVQVSCRKIKSNAPTAGDGMTVAPSQ